MKYSNCILTPLGHEFLGDEGKYDILAERYTEVLEDVSGRLDKPIASCFDQDTLK